MTKSTLIAGHKHTIQLYFADVNLIGSDFLDDYQISGCFGGAERFNTSLKDTLIHEFSIWTLLLV